MLHIAAVMNLMLMVVCRLTRRDQEWI